LKSLGAAPLITTVGVQDTKDIKEKHNYRTILKVYTKHPKHVRKNSIRSFISTTTRGWNPLPATLAATGDETTWSLIVVHWCVVDTRKVVRKTPRARL
jgi:hypothetical protein